MGQAENVQRIDLHALIPRFASLRLHDAPKLARLVASIEQQGQLMPVVAVPEADKAGPWVLRGLVPRFTQEAEPAGCLWPAEV